MFVDTHCHIHESEFYTDDREEVFQRAIKANVKMICIGTNEQHSREAVEFAEQHAQTWATVGVHPHDTKDGWQDIGKIIKDNHEKVVGIGEIGLDYFYDNSPRSVQINALEEQLQLATDYNLPVCFHVREAFDDFWSVLRNFSGIRGVLHSFTDTIDNLEKGLGNGFYVGVNGISTFTKNMEQQRVFDAIPLEKLLLETDAPFLTPNPYRGRINEPAFVRVVAEYHAQRRGIRLEELAKATSANASTLFSL